MSPGTTDAPAVDEVTGSTLATGATAVRLSPNSFWTKRVESAPLAANSDAVAIQLRSQVTGVYGGVSAFNRSRYTTTFYSVPPGHRRIDVRFDDCQDKGGAPDGVYNGAKHFLDVPVPWDAVASEGSDGAMAIYDPAADQLWEFWKMQKDPRRGWSACWGGRVDHASRNQGMFPTPFGVTATGVMMSPGMVTLAEVRNGSIDHALYLTVRQAQAMPRISWPALRGDGNVVNSNVVMQGQRLRLDPTLDLSTYDLTPVGRMVARAAQRYGFVVTDKGGAVALIGESGERERRVTGVDPWPRLLGVPSYEVMRNFPWDKVQVVKRDWGKP